LQTSTLPGQSALMRELPAWFDDAKLGIFIHWYAASVPAFAPLSDDPFTLAEQHGWDYAMAHSPYAEWYWNSREIAGSPAAEHHAEVWRDHSYADFVSMWGQANVGWDPERWADLFRRAGAKYVVAGTKHHDGVLLWPSKTPNPHRSNWNAGRDLVGPLVDAVRAQNMRLGLYYSGGLDWTFAGPGAADPEHRRAISNFHDMIACVPASTEYATYVHAHWTELIETYQPHVLWNDISHPRAGSWADLFEQYYEAVPDGVVNDRFDLRGVMKGSSHADFTTPEYRTESAIASRKFEVCRGIGRSFGYNSLESEVDLLSPRQLIWEFVDIIARGGNLLLNVGPTARGEIPFAQQLRLAALGNWLDVHGESIYGTRPWDRQTSETSTGAPVRFTASSSTVNDPNRTVFALVSNAAAGPSLASDVVISGVTLAPTATVRLVGEDSRRPSLRWETVDRVGPVNEPGVRIELPCAAPETPAYALALTGATAVATNP
jgi:alpha-L-fucosidase